MSRLKVDQHETQLLRSRLLQAFIVVAVLQLVLIGRFAWLQIYAHDRFAAQSEGNRIRQNPIVPPRGLIFDRNGVLLAENRPAFRLELVPEQNADFDATWNEMARIIALTEEDREEYQRERAQQRKFQSVTIKSKLSENDVAALSVQLHRFPGIYITPYLTRFYPMGDLTAHVVGYVGRIDVRELEAFSEQDHLEYLGVTHIGKLGIESRYEKMLRGTPGFERVEVNAAGRTVRVLKRVPPVPGRNLFLTIDTELQRKTVDAYADNIGAAVAIDPNNGEVLAMVSRPSFDPNVYINGISKQNYQVLMSDPLRPTFHRALSGRYPPGSTYKPFMGLAGLELGLRTKDSITHSRGIFYLPRAARGWRDWKAGGHGPTNLRESIAQSVNTYYYQLAVDIGIDRMHEYHGQFSFGRPTGIDLNSEGSGILPSKAWKASVSKQPWYPGETVVAGIGQGAVSVTPLQLASATATLAAYGVRREPILLLASERPAAGDLPRDRVLNQAKAYPSFVKNPANVDAVIEGMIAVLHGPTGTARAWGRNSSFIMAGKTGTAQVVSANAPRDASGKLDPRFRNQALFMGFAPADAPKIAIGLVVEQGESGSGRAAPLGRKIFEGYLGNTVASATNPVVPSDPSQSSQANDSEEIPLDSLEAPPIDQAPQASAPIASPPTANESSP